MFNIGLIELLIIIFFSIIFIKPEEIPKITKNLGLFYRKVSRHLFNFKHEISKLDIDLKKNKKDDEWIILIISEN